MIKRIFEDNKVKRINLESTKGNRKDRGKTQLEN